MRQSKRKTIVKKSDREQLAYIRNPEFLGCYYPHLELEKYIRLNDLEINILIVGHYFVNQQESFWDGVGFLRDPRRNPGVSYRDISDIKKSVLNRFIKPNKEAAGFWLKL